MAGFIGNKIGGTPALQLPDDKGRRRGGENPAGGARGGWRSEGGLRFFSQEARRDDYNQLLQPAFNLAASTICSVQQTLAVDSYAKVKVVRWAWVRGRQFGTFVC